MASGAESQFEDHVRKELKIDHLHSLTCPCTLCIHEQMCSFVKWWLLTMLLYWHRGTTCPRKDVSSKYSSLVSLCEELETSPHMSADIIHLLSESE